MSYTIEALSQAETYRDSQELEQIAKRVAVMEYDAHGRGRCTLGVFRREVLGGQHPDLVAAYLAREALQGGALHKLMAANAAQLWGLQEKYGIHIDIRMKTGLVLLQGAGRDAYLEEAARKAGGWRVDQNTLTVKLVHAERLAGLLKDWYQLRQRQSAGASLEAMVRAAQIKQRAG